MAIQETKKESQTEQPNAKLRLSSSHLLPPMVNAVVAFLLLLLHGGVASMSDTEAILRLKSSFDNSSSLSSWTSDHNSSNPCNSTIPWAGVVCEGSVVTGLLLVNMSLSGTIDINALSSIKNLRTLSFSGNSFSGALPPFYQLPALKSIHLSDNRFSGPIRDDFFDTMTHLKKLWLDGNTFNGTIPSSLFKQTTTLIELHLESNKFSGRMRWFAPPLLTSFNVSNNDLEGTVPASFWRFGAKAFENNPYLCYNKTYGQKCMKPQTVTTLSAKLVLVFAMFIIVMAAVVLSVTRCSKRRSGVFQPFKVDNSKSSPHTTSIRSNTIRVLSSHGGISKRAGSSSTKSAEVGGGGGTDLVMVNEAKGVFVMQDLMKAASEVIGSGGMGSAFKAAMANGAVVVVKRMQDMNREGKEAFDVAVRRLGNLRHPNVLPPLAYHYGREEKLLVYEYMPKGSLLYVLHGDCGQDHAALDWPTRLKIARRIAEGMAYLHAALPSVEVPHGNLKSSNVLLAPDFEPLLADYGLLPFLNPAFASHVMSAYHTPEYQLHRHVSSKSDVYCLGVLLLELLTGKFPSQYSQNANGGTDLVSCANAAIAEAREAELLDPVMVAKSKAALPEMKRLLRIGVDCVESDPDRRPEMKGLVDEIEELAAVAAAARIESKTTANCHEAYVRDSLGERSTRRTGNIGERTERRNGNDFSIGIS